MQKIKIRILFVFTCAVVEVVDQNDQHESDAYDPGHDGSVSAAFTTERANYSTREEKP